MVFQTIPKERVQPVACVNYPSERVPYTRVTEFKHLTGQEHPSTTLGYEFPTADGEPTHPVPKAENRALYERYVARARETAPHVTFAGRLGTYKYLDMDQCVAQALKLAETLILKGAA
jgi:UDP-galactopyranose mutase